MSLANSESASRSANWKRLEELTRRAVSGGVASLSEDELWELPSLYRRTLADVSLLRASGMAPHDEQRLSQLCNQAHGVIYAKRQSTERGPGVLAWLLHALPAAAQRRRWYIAAAGCVLLFFAAAGAVHAMLSPQIVETVLPPQVFRGWQAELETARSQADLRLAAQIAQEERPAAAFQITLNNVRVSVLAVVSGILGGLPALLILGFNGYLLGVIGFLYFSSQSPVDVNLPLYFWAGIAPHGSIELPAIAIAGGAGMLIGFAWLFPGQRPRGDAMRAVVPDAMRLLAICAITLLIAGPIEGFITPLYPPESISFETWFWLKILFGVLVFAGWFAWLANPKARLAGLE